VWSLDNKYVIYAKNEELWGIKIGGFEEFLVSEDGGVKGLCAPHYLVVDRVSKNIISASRAGVVCKYKI
jgi:hypothetical protein